MYCDPFSNKPSPEDIICSDSGCTTNDCCTTRGDHCYNIPQETSLNDPGFTVATTCATYSTITAEPCIATGFNHIL